MALPRTFFQDRAYMRFTRLLGASSAGLFLAVYPDVALGRECDLNINNCTYPETCTPVTIPGVVVPLNICAQSCDAPCPAECCNKDLKICEVPGRSPNGQCSNNCGCESPKICCPETMVCGTPLTNDPTKCEETCGEWQGACDDPLPVDLPVSTKCTGDCDEDQCCRSETCGEWDDGECVDPTPVYLGDGEDCGGTCDDTTCCREPETCGEWEGEWEDPTPVREDDSVDCCASCGDCETTCCRSETCGEWEGECEDPTPNRLGNNVDCIGTCDISACCDDAECEDDMGVPDNDKCGAGLICCPETGYCGTPGILNPLACGDPHMTGFLGQMFDFTGEDGGWYALIADVNINVNMRVTSPIVDLPEITYITGLSIVTTDADGLDHSIVIEVKDPHNLDSSCPAGMSPCLADGSLRVVLDGEETLLAPGTVSMGQGVRVSAVNLPGACRSFGFEKYWERKELENARHGRRLGEPVSMGEWILGDPTATNMDECVEYVARAEVEDGGLFAHQSEHASFQIVTPKATIRLSHGRLHQIAMRDPTDQFDLPDHLTWQMNMAVDHNEVSHDAKGVLGETFVPTRDANGKPIMTGMEAIRGKQEDYRVKEALGMDFVQDTHTS